MSKNNDFNELSEKSTSGYKFDKNNSKSKKKEESMQDLEKHMGMMMAKGIISSLPLRVKICIILISSTSIYGTINLVIKLINLF